MTGGINTARMRIAFFAFLAFWSLLVWRLAAQCLWPSQDLREKAVDLKVSRMELPAARGEILDRHGAPLVTNVTRWSLYGNPAQLGNMKRVAALIAEATGDPEAATLARLGAMPPRYQCLAAELRYPENLRAGLAARYGMDLRERHQRLYPEGSLGAHVLGMVGKDGNGLEGLELSFDRDLRGEPGWIVCLRDGAGGYYPAAGMPEEEPVSGKTLLLTLDREIQSIAEMVLNDAVDRYRAAGGSIVVLEPATGDVLAIANSPSYDPRDVGASEVEARRNRALTDTYEPGSTMKVVLASLVLDKGLMDSEDSMFAELGSYSLGHGVLRDSHPHGWLTFREAFAQSSNIFFYKLANLVSDDDFYRAMRDFGFGAPTGIALPGEASGVLRKPSLWSARSEGTMAIGQEVSVTPLQLAMAYATVADHGVLMRPRIVRGIIDPRTGQETDIPPCERRRVVSAKTAEMVASFCEGVVAEGTGTKAQLAGVRVGGKTGTAQIAAPNGGGYRAGAYAASFVGFAPVDAPRFVSLVVLREPKEGHYGGSVAAPAFGELAARLLALPTGPVPTPDEGRRYVSRDGARNPGDGAGGDARSRGASRPGGTNASDGGAGVTTPAVAALVSAPDIGAALDRAARDLRAFRASERRREAAPAVTPAVAVSRAPAAVTAAGSPAMAAAPISPASTLSSGTGGPADSGATVAAGPPQVAVPDLRGLTLREARRTLAGLGLVAVVNGSGVVRESVPAGGTLAPPGSRVALKATLAPAD